MLYINADDIKREEKLSDKEAFDKAERLREDCLKDKRDLCFETVFSHESKLEFMRKAKDLGYEIRLIFVTTFDPEINKKRVEFRVCNGGHDVPPDKIVSRYERTMSFLPNAIALADIATVYNNSMESPVIIVEKVKNEIAIYPQTDPSKWTYERLLQLKNEIEMYMDPRKE